MIAIMATDIAFIHSNTIDFVFVFNARKDAKKINPLLAVSLVVLARILLGGEN